MKPRENIGEAKKFFKIQRKYKENTGKPGAARRGGRRSQEQPGGARRSQEEPGAAYSCWLLRGARGSQEKPGAARRSQELQLAKKTA